MFTILQGMKKKTEKINISPPLPPLSIPFFNIYNTKECSSGTAFQVFSF